MWCNSVWIGREKINVKFFASVFAVTDSKQSSSSSEYSLKMRQKLQDILPRKSMVREYHTNTIFFVTSDPELVVDQNHHSGC